MIFDKNVSEELVVAISQYKAVDYTLNALKCIENEGIPFTSLILFDGTPVSFNKTILRDKADISIDIQDGIHSLPHIWNILYGVAKLCKGAKYLYWQDCDIELQPGSLVSMLDNMKVYKSHIVSPLKIDNDSEKLKDYNHEPSHPLRGILGFNDSSVLFDLNKLPFFPFEYEYAPYQFEITALSYELWKQGLKSRLDCRAVAFHHCSSDIQHSPEERQLGSSTWDQKLEIFKEKHKDEPKMQWFVDNVIMNSENASKYGFPCYLL